MEHTHKGYVLEYLYYNKQEEDEAHKVTKYGFIGFQKNMRNNKSHAEWLGPEGWAC